ncbi:MAG: TIM barrel protein [Methanomicrobium sp.]|nr:TIM barrel protein [Methanomicrobium sp.]
MHYNEFLNFSVYQFDIDKFNGDWKILKQMLRNYGLGGVELLTDFKQVPENIPPEIVGAVHFPSFMGMYRVWTDNSFTIPDYINKDLINYFYGGCTKDEILSNFCNCINYAESKKPAYGVYHAGYMETEHAFLKHKFASDREVLKVSAEFLNEAAASFPGGEPPFYIAIENLWWPGLTFLDPDAALEFMEMLEFKKWFFMLDTGHLMSAYGDCHCEEEGIEKVLSILNMQDKQVIDKIQGVHLHFSASGDYQRTMHEPDEFKEMPFEEKSAAIMRHLKFFDEHRPFTSKRCRKIIEFVKPDFVTHEFTGLSRKETDEALKIQVRASKN